MSLKQFFSGETHIASIDTKDHGTTHLISEQV
jgi:hypothetical protein